MIRDLNQTIAKQRIGGSGYFFIFDENDHVLAHPYLTGHSIKKYKNLLTNNFLAKDLKKAAFSSINSTEYLWDKPNDRKGYRFRKKAYVCFHKELGWYICTSMYHEDLEKKLSSFLQMMLVFFLCFLLVALIASLWISKNITGALNRLVMYMSQTDSDGIPIGNISVSGTNEIQFLGATINHTSSLLSKNRERS